MSFEIQIEWMSAHTAVSRISARPRDISLIEFLSQIDETAPPARSRTVPARAFELQYYRVDPHDACTWVHNEPSPDPCRAVETSSGASEV